MAGSGKGGGGGGRAASGAGVVGAGSGLTFTPAGGVGRDYVTVVADVRKLEQSLAKDKGFHVGKGGTGAAKPGAYEGVKTFVQKAKRQHIPIEQPKVTIHKGEASIVDGRHRFAYFRDQGRKSLPVSVHKTEAKEFRDKFGK